jgi:hypothetical protein
MLPTILLGSPGLVSLGESVKPCFRTHAGPRSTRNALPPHWYAAQRACGSYGQTNLSRARDLARCADLKIRTAALPMQSVIFTVSTPGNC